MLYIIAIIGILLIIFNLNSVKEDKYNFNDILKNEEKRQNKDYDLEIISIRKDLAESLLDIQKEIELLKEEIKEIKDKNSNFDNKKEDNVDIISEINFNNKINSEEKVNLKNERIINVKLLLDNGKTEDEICNELKIGKGEVLLIKNLLRK